MCVLLFITLFDAWFVLFVIFGMSLGFYHVGGNF
jgi:hypothetical protein